MIDTVKMTLAYQNRPKWLDRVQKDTGYVANSGVFTATIYPSKSYKRAGITVPQLRYVEQPATRERAKSYVLNVELSLPKLFFGNNFYELTDKLLSDVVNELHRRLRNIYGLRIAPSRLMQAEVSRIDYAKNIVFTDRTPVSTIVGAMATGDISKTYDVQKTNFKNGGLIYHIHANIIDIVMYDKVADLKQAKVSEKRSHEKYNQSQIKLIDEFDARKNLSVARFEIRLSTKSKIRKELKAVDISDDLRFCHVFSADISRKILLRHWQKIVSQIPKTEIVADTATQILVSHIQANPEMKFAEASALTVMQLLRKEAQDERAVRNIIEGLFSPAQYYRLKKKGHYPPTKAQLNSLLYITETLTAMKPINGVDYVS